MKKLYYLIVIVLISSLVLTGCLLSNVGQVPATEQSGISYLTKAILSPNNLVGLWHFDGDAKDSSGDFNNGIVDGTTEYVDSPMGQAFSFNGSTCVHVLDSGTLDVTRVTLEAWVKPSVSKQRSYARIVFKGTNSPFKPLYFLAYDSTGEYMRMVVYIGGLGKTAISTTALIDTDKWYHIAGTYDGIDVKIYVDGALENTTNVPADGDIDIGMRDLGIGRNPEANIYGYKGLIDEVRIWNFALSQDQLGKVYDFVGFFPPVDDNVLNVVKAGRAIPVKFSLDGYQGLEDIIFVPGYPKSIPIVCPGKDEPVGVMEFAETAGESSLSYDADAYQYIYVWKTEKTWAGSCRQLVVKLIDGTSHVANFTFK